jgi:hypothetical protein
VGKNEVFKALLIGSVEVWRHRLLFHTHRPDKQFGYVMTTTIHNDDDDDAGLSSHSSHSSKEEEEGHNRNMTDGI